MTPEERAADIVEEKRRYWEPWLTLIGGCPPTRALVEEKLQAFIADAIRAAVAEEWERCAKVCEDTPVVEVLIARDFPADEYGDDATATLANAAAAIRGFDATK